MPNIKSAKKRLRQNEVRQAENLVTKGRMRSARRKFLDSIESGDAEAAKASYALFCSTLDKAAKKGVIKKNTAIRSKTRGAAKLRSLWACR